jgi:glycosyltransferase involved in cell wall biosynthesis
MRRDLVLNRTDSPVVGAVPFNLARHWIHPRRIWPHILAYRDVSILTTHIDALPRPFLTVTLARGLARRNVIVRDTAGRVRRISSVELARLGARFARDQARAGRVLRRSAELAESLGGPDAGPVTAGRTLYLRTDPPTGLRSGGSVGHIAGVLGGLADLDRDPIFVTTEAIATVRPTIETHVADGSGAFLDIPELPLFAGTDRLISEARHAVGSRRPSFVYQRYSLGNMTGAVLAREWFVPFALEYNGSEVWIHRNWGRPLKHERLALDIEMANLRCADLVVVVSQVMREELVGRGIDAGRILVNPNGVDPALYSPDLDGSALRAQLGLEGMLVTGFIGTFGPWHGAETLAAAFGILIARRPDLRERVRLLMIGDGARLDATRQAIRAGDVEAETVFVGRTDQADGPAYLAACDILASPHVPNPDGTRFFGSPTKLFEYMAMGKAIVASRLEQIGEVLEDDRTAALVEPGNAAELARALEALVDDPERRARLGAGAREAAVANHTWLDHTRRILDRIASLGA